jgi:hypothetical protein
MSKKQVEQVEQQVREDYAEEDKADLEAQAKLQQQYIAEALAEPKTESTYVGVPIADVEMPARFTNGGATAEERDAWIKEHGYVSPA